MALQPPKLAVPDLTVGPQKPKMYTSDKKKQKNSPSRRQYTIHSFLASALISSQSVDPNFVSHHCSGDPCGNPAIGTAHSPFDVLSRQSLSLTFVSAGSSQ